MVQQCSAYKEKSRKNQKKSINLLRSAEVFIDKVLSLGGRRHLKLPAEHELWNDEQFKKFEESHGMCRVYFHGCAYQEALRSVSTTDLRLIEYLDQYKCSGGHEHEHAMGGNASRTANYTQWHRQSLNLCIPRSSITTYLL